MDHDQNFKNLILDYPYDALELFAGKEAKGLDSHARIIPIREEQLKRRLGDRFRELDVPLLVEWPDGTREAILFALEEESEANRFSIHRLAHYCLVVGLSRTYFLRKRLLPTDHTDRHRWKKGFYVHTRNEEPGIHMAPPHPR